MFEAVVQRLTLGALSLSLLVGCGQAAPDGTADPQAQSTGPAAVSTAQIETTPTESAPPVTDEALRQAVQGYSDAFLGGEPTTAYEYFSARCKDQVSLSYFTGIIIAAKQVYGTALPITSYDAEVSGDLARVSYTYDVPALDQTDEPWAREDGAWKQDDC
jgi:hypothetical protein